MLHRVPEPRGDTGSTPARVSMLAAPGWPLRRVHRGRRSFIHSSGITDERPGDSITAVGRHTVALRDRSGGCRRADDLPDSTLRANFGCSGRRSNRLLHCIHSRDWLMKLPLGVQIQCSVDLVKLREADQSDGVASQPGPTERRGRWRSLAFFVLRQSPAVREAAVFSGDSVSASASASFFLSEPRPVRSSRRCDRATDSG